MGRNRGLVVFILAILGAVGAMDGVRCIGKYVHRVYLRYPIGRNVASPVIYGNDSVRLVPLLCYRPQSLCNSVDTPD